MDKPRHPQMIRTLKGILAGAAAFLASMFLFNLIGMSVMWLFPEITKWLFPDNYHELGWGGFYDFPLWQSWIVGIFACAITFVWLYRKPSETR
jgi:hypothetical protein